MHLESGHPYPLGATWDGAGVNFALFSQHAHKVELCLVDAHGHERRYELPECTDHVWHGYFPQLLPGQRYGYRVHGPYLPDKGHRFNPHKLLLDPYTRAIGRDLNWHDALFGYTIGRDDLSYDTRDSGPFAPLGVVVEGTFSWGDDRPPGIPWQQSLIYELHVKGFTRRMPGVPEPLRGTYLGLASDAALRHLQSLGVTAVELLPIHYRVNDRHLVEKGLSNYWGYNTLGYFAPDPRFATAPHDPEAVLREFKIMVRRLHQAGIEVILDVVYNHTAEGNHFGPTLCFKGIDNAAYYALSPEHPRYYMDFTGCGNSPNMRHPRVLQLIMDSLRYWVQEMHIDGFRFDLAVTLGRVGLHADMNASLFQMIQQDPILARVKLLAEPWDLGPDGYRVGGFPPGWAEWNDRFRNSIRSFWAGHGIAPHELGQRLSGSPDLYAAARRRPWASINYITCHDGFTLADLVSYNHKHNQANGEDNRDGSDHNNSWNCGIEGPTTDATLLSLRYRQVRNLVGTLLLSNGVPMLLAGDEYLHTQAGNNNTYCQDNELTWLDWSHTAERSAFLAYVQRLLAFRRDHPRQRQTTFPQKGELRWYSPEGEELPQETQMQPTLVVGLRWAGQLDPEPSPTLFLAFNASTQSVIFHLPRAGRGYCWEWCFDTSEDARQGRLSGNSCRLAAHSLGVLRLVPH
ncbi:MAG: glycogen debranching protein GlgX [Gemmataceae bacterium]